MENTIMTRQDAIAIIEETAARYGMTTVQSRCCDIPGIHRAKDAYIDFMIRVDENYDSFNAETKTIEKRIVASASVCQMNPNADVDELLRAASEIQTGALFVAELQRLNLKWVHQL